MLFGYDHEQVLAEYEPSLLDPIEREYEFVSGLVSEYRFALGPRTELRMHGIPREILDQATAPTGQRP